MDDKNSNTGKVEIVRQFIRFNIVGVINTIITYGIYSGLVFIGLSHLVALVLEYACGICLSYELNKRFTFGHRHEGDRGAFSRMVIAYVPTFFVNAVLLWLFADALGWNEYLAQAIAMGCVSVISFFAQRIFVFRRGKVASHGQ